MVEGCPAVIPVIETQKPHEKQLPPSGGLAGIEVALGGKTTYINSAVEVVAERANFPQGEDAKPPVPKGDSGAAEVAYVNVPCHEVWDFFLGTAGKSRND